MTYHPLTKETGGNADDNFAESRRILKILDDYANTDEMTSAEQGFIAQMESAEGVTPKQLLWLRDIKDKYC